MYTNLQLRINSTNFFQKVPMKPGLIFSYDLYITNRAAILELVLTFSLFFLTFLLY